MGTPQFALHLFFTAAAYNKNAAALQKQDSCAFVIYPAVLVRRLCFLLCSSGWFLVDLALIIHREHDDQNGHSGKDHGDGRGGDGKEVAALDVHVADEVLFAHGSQNESQQNGRKREPPLIPLKKISGTPTTNSRISTIPSVGVAIPPTGFCPSSRKLPLPLVVSPGSIRC